MVAICFYFQVHQPLRLNKLRIFDINGNKKNYFNNDLNCGIFKKVSKNAYIPMNSLILDLIDKTNGNFKVAFSLSGLSLKQMEEYHPETLISFLKLKNTNNVEFLNETYHHSLSSLFSEEEFHHDILKHKEEFYRIFENEPKIFRNTELLYGDVFDNIISSHGFKGVLIDGNPILKLGKSPNFIYGKENSELKLICKNCELSDDIAFRYGKSPKENLLKEIMIKINNLEKEGADLINFFMDYETFGEHFPKESGIFDFFEELILELNEKEFEFLTPSEILEKYTTKENINLDEISSWADEKGIDAWLDNEIQKESLRTYAKTIEKAKDNDDDILLDTLRNLSSSDHFYYMSTKELNDGVIHDYFSAYESPYDAYIYYMNTLNDINMQMDNNQEIKNFNKLNLNANPSFVK